MKKFFWVIFVAAVAIAQVAFSPSILKGKIDFLLLLVIFIAFHQQSSGGAAAGFFGGLIEDYFSVGVLGVNCFLKTVIGSLVGILGRRFYRQHVALQMLVVWLATLVNEFFLLLASYSGETSLWFWLRVRNVVLPASVYNALLSPLIFWLLEHLMKRVKS